MPNPSIIAAYKPFNRMLNEIEPDGPQGANLLLPLVYNELRKLAAAQLTRESPDQTLQPTALVHEAWLRLAGADSRTPFANRAHFFAAAAEAMRRILIERARAKATRKRGGGWSRINFDSVDVATDANEETLLLINESLARLAKENPRAAQIVQLRFFTGLSLEQAGEVLGVTQRTAKRDWAFARSWLYHYMQAFIQS